MKKSHIFKSVLCGTLIVVCMCACGNHTAQYMETEETQWSEPETEPVEIETGYADESDSSGEICVYVCGEIAAPGVYTLPEGSRVCDLFEAAGGITEQGATDYWNQAEYLTDGEMICVPTIEEAKERARDFLQTSGAETTDDGNAKININTASRTQLMTIPGIGGAKADAILAYREANGSFSSIEEVKKVEGIKDGVYEKMKEYISIN